MKHTRTVALAVALAALSSACASAPKRPEVVWPPPPETPRIKFVDAYFTEQDVDRSGWASFKRGLLGDDRPFRLVQPMGLALSSDGERLYVADFGAGTVYLLDFKARTFKPLSLEGGALSQPFNVALDAEENLYVSDSATRSILRFDRSGRRVWQVSDDLVRPTGLALDQQRQVLYVADTARVDSQKHRVFAYDLKGKRLHQIGKERGSGPGEFHFPSFLGLDQAGNLHVGDTMNFRIQVFGPDGGYLKSLGEQGDNPGSFQRIKGIAFDGFGVMYVADGGPSVVQMFNSAFQPLMFFGGFAPLLEYFDVPSAIAIDRRTNRIYVGVQSTARINVYQLINTTAEDTQPKPAEPAAKPAR